MPFVLLEKSPVWNRKYNPAVMNLLQKYTEVNLLQKFVDTNFGLCYISYG